MTTYNSDDNLSLPMEKMPESWFKDDRMNAMFAEFRNRSVNPQDWDSKYKFWDELISDWLSENKQCSFTIFQLSSAFRRKGRTPLCLPTVINELYKKGEVLTENEFLIDQMATWTSWAVNTMVKKPITWSFSKLKNYFISNIISDQDIKYIHMKTIRELANIILSLAKDEKELILSVREITTRCNEKLVRTNITEENVELALVWIMRLNNNKFSIINNHSKNECLFKLHANKIDSLTKADEDLFKLQESERKLMEKIEALEIERNELLVKAKSSMNSGLREVAKTYVRKKRELDKRIEKHASVLQNLHVLISNIHDAHSNTDVLAAYKKGNEILKGFEMAGLTEFTVRDTMDEITETVSDMTEVQKALSETFKMNDSDSELEEELLTLINDNLHDTSLPSVPGLEPSDLEEELGNLQIKDLPQLPETLNWTLNHQTNKKIPN